MKGTPCPKGKDLIQALPWSKSCQQSACGHWHGNPDTGWCACDLQDMDNLAALAAQAGEGERE
jgi:hypothetical protein